MGKKLDKIVSVGASVGTAVSLWDRISGWWSRRREAKLEARRVAQWVKASIAVHRTMFEHDLKLTRAGAVVCKKSGGCLRPDGHLGPCGPVLLPEWRQP
jgi:hypothetical protein